MNLQIKFWQGSEQTQAAWSASFFAQLVNNSGPSEWTEFMVQLCSFHLDENNKYLLGLNKINCIVQS